MGYLDNTGLAYLWGKIKPKLVQPDWQQNDQTAPDYVKSRPGGYDAPDFYIAWDGVIGNRLTVPVSDTMQFVKVSGRSLGINNINGSIVYSNVSTGSEMISDVTSSNVVVNSTIAFVSTPGWGNGEVTFPESGIYFLRMTMGMQTAFITRLEVDLAPVKIPQEYLDLDGYSKEADAILSTPQTLTDAQKQQARANIGLTPVAKTDAMTQSVGLDVDGGLYTEPGAWYVTVTQTSSDSVMATADKTAAEVYAAYQAGYVVYARVRLANVRVGFYVLPLDACIPNGNGGVATLGFSVAGQHSSAEPPKVIGVLFRNNQWVIMSTDLAGLKDIPTALPNPNALTIKVGDTTTTYDGSADKTVDIPDSTIIQSSTSGSTKKFRITVDDSGTLSAVEVTDAS